MVTYYYGLSYQAVYKVVESSPTFTNSNISDASGLMHL